MCWDLFREADNCIRGAIGCLCLLVIGGPVLFIVGIVVLLAPNNRDSTVNTYNTAVTNFNSTTISASWTSGTIGGQAFTLQAQPVQLLGDLTGVSTASSLVAQSVVATSVTNLVYNVSSITPFSRTVATSTTKTVSMTCTSSYCSGSGSNCRCYQQQMSSKCFSIAVNGVAINVPNSCSTGSSCGVCQYTAFLTIYTAVAAKSSEDSAHQSVLYPFTAATQVYSPMSSPPTSYYARLYSSLDPLLAAQQLTHGTMDFGITQETQRKIGIALIVVGVVLTTAVCGGAFILYKCQTQKNQGQPAVPPTQHAGVPHFSAEAGAYGQPGYAQGGYGQPQPQYNQAQPAGPVFQYNQPGFPPQPGYGQPPPNFDPHAANNQPHSGYPPPQPAFAPQAGYGQPQAMYGQPQATGYTVNDKPQSV